MLKITSQDKSDVQQSILHERQRLQLCALHTINNLLQLSSRSLHDRGEVSKSELDAIADEIASKEIRLFDLSVGSEEEENNGNHLPKQNTSLTFLQKMFSHHRTPIFGNYSFEVLETALKKRGISLQWHDINKPSIENDTLKDEIVGFVLNTAESPNAILQFIPYFKNARHWFCVIRKSTDNGLTNAEAKEHDVSNVKNDIWIVLDSKKEDKILFRGQFELIDYLREIQEKGGNIFAAMR